MRQRKSISITFILWPDISWVTASEHSNVLNSTSAENSDWQVVAEQRPLAAVHFTAFSIHGSIGPVLTQSRHLSVLLIFALKGVQVHIESQVESSTFYKIEYPKVLLGQLYLPDNLSLLSDTSAYWPPFLPVFVLFSNKTRYCVKSRIYHRNRNAY